MQEKQTYLPQTRATPFKKEGREMGGGILILEIFQVYSVFQ